MNFDDLDTIDAVILGADEVGTSPGLGSAITTAARELARAGRAYLDALTMAEMRDDGPQPEST